MLEWNHPAYNSFKSVGLLLEVAQRLTTLLVWHVSIMNSTRWLNKSHFKVIKHIRSTVGVSPCLLPPDESLSLTSEASSSSQEHCCVVDRDLRPETCQVSSSGIKRAIRVLASWYTHYHQDYLKVKVLKRSSHWLVKMSDTPVCCVTAQRGWIKTQSQPILHQQSRRNSDLQGDVSPD